MVLTHAEFEAILADTSKRIEGILPGSQMRITRRAWSSEPKWRRLSAGRFSCAAVTTP